MAPLVHSLALLTAGLFAGTCLYVTAVGHPSRLLLGALPALALFKEAVQR